MAITITTNSQTIVISAGTPITNLSQINTSDEGYNNAQEELTAHEAAILTIPTVEEQAAWDALNPSTGVTFTGEISLGKLYTNYATYTPASNLAVTLNATKVIGGSADIRMIGNGVNAPTFAAFTKHPSSGDYVNTLGTVNYIVFYFNGTESIYSINQL